MSKTYRTLVRGRLVQQSGLCVGGSEAPAGAADRVFARDGRGRLTLSGDGLAGAFVETAGRIHPPLLHDAAETSPWLRASGKSRLGRGKDGSDGEAGVWESVWRFTPAHLLGVAVERRQGVGIRRDTGAAAADGRALYDTETVPAGSAWNFFFEVDTLQGGNELEALALLALCEWARGRCWLGASAARGLGWMTLDDLDVLRLPAVKDVIAAWPDNTRTREELWTVLTPKTERVVGAAAVRKKALELWPRALGQPDRFCYLRLTATFAAGKREDGYGWDSLSVGGHAAGAVAPLTTNLAKPQGMAEKEFLKEYVPDAPVVTSSLTKDEKRIEQPVVPGGGVRGPLRHAASAWRKGGHPEETIPDPNVNEPGTDARPEDDDHPLSKLFGLLGHSARLLVRDAAPADGNFILACVQHHAEDEFTAGVYGSGKFDRTAVLAGTLGTELVLEAKDEQTIRQDIDQLLPALELAAAGFVPLGGGKWRGHGWLRWRFAELEYGRAGDEPRVLKVTGPNVRAGVDALLATPEAKS